MAWRNARLATVLALGGLACGRTELIALDGGTESGGTVGTSGATAGLDTGGFDTGRPTSGLDSGGPITVTVTFTTGFDSGVLDTGFDEVTGFPGTSSTITTGVTTEIDETGFPGTGGTTTGTSETSTTTTTTTTATSGPDTDGGTTSGGSTDGGTTSGGTTSGGSTDGGTTSGGTTDGGTTGGGDFTCLDAVDCVLGCGGASFSCIGQCNDALTPEDAAAFNDLETCIIFACIFNGSCGFDFGSPGCVACRVDGQLDPATLACDDEAAACTG